MLDGRSFIPRGQFVLAHCLHHAIPNTVKEILADRWSFFPITWWNHPVNQSAEIDILTYMVRQPQGPKLFYLKGKRFLSLTGCKGKYSCW